jgi:TP901 family phage tail tape measure protein
MEDNNKQQEKIEVLIQPVISPEAAEKAKTDIQTQIGSAQVRINELRGEYEGNTEFSPVIDTMLNPLEELSKRLTEIGNSIANGIDTSKLSRTRQELVETISAIGKFQPSKQGAQLRQLEKVTTGNLAPFVSELSRVAPAYGKDGIDLQQTIWSIVQSDLGDRMQKAAYGATNPDYKSSNAVQYFLKGILPSIYKGGFQTNGNPTYAFNVRDYLPDGSDFQKADMNYGWLQKQFAVGYTKEATKKNLAKQISELKALAGDSPSEDQTKEISQLQSLLNETKTRSTKAVLRTDNMKQIREEFVNNKRFAKVLIDAGIARKEQGESTYSLPTQITPKMMGQIAVGLQKAYVAATAGYGSPDVKNIVKNPFEISTSGHDLANLPAEKKKAAYRVVNRGQYESAQAIIHAMGMMQGIKDKGAGAYILPSLNGEESTQVRVPNVSRTSFRYQKLRVGNNGIEKDGTVLYQDSEAIRFLNRYGKQGKQNVVKNINETQGQVTPAFVVVDVDDVDPEKDPEKAKQIGNVVDGLTAKNGKTYSYLTRHRGDEGHHITLVDDSLRKRAEEKWRSEQIASYKGNATTSILWDRGAEIAKKGKLSYEDIQGLNAYDRAAYKMYSSVMYASPFTAYSQIGVKDMPDNAVRAKTQDALNKQMSPSQVITERIADVVKDKNLLFHYVNDEDKADSLSGNNGGLIGNNGSYYLSSDIIPYDAQSRGLWGALKGMAIALQADSSGDIYSGLKQSGMLDQNGQLIIGGRDVSHGLGIITQSVLKSPDIKDMMDSIKASADKYGLVTNANGQKISWQRMQDEVLTQLMMNSEISSVTRTIDKKNKSDKIGSQFSAHIAPNSEMLKSTRKMPMDLDDLENNPDKALEMVFPSDEGDITSRELHRLKEERDKDPTNQEAAKQFSDAMKTSTVVNRIRSFAESRKAAIRAGNYFDSDDVNGSIGQGILGTSFMQRVLLSARQDESNKDLSNVDLLKKMNPRLLEDAVRVGRWKESGFRALTSEQKNKIAANAMLLDDVFAGFSEEEMQKLKDNGLIDMYAGEKSKFVFNPLSDEYRLALHRDPSTRKDLLTAYNGAFLFSGLKDIRRGGFTDSQGRNQNSPYASMFGNVIAVNPKDWEYLAGADEDGDAIKFFAGVYYNLLKQGNDANKEIEDYIYKYYKDDVTRIKANPITEDTPESDKEDILRSLSRSMTARVKMARYSGNDSRVAQLGLTPEMIADGANPEAVKYAIAAWRAGKLYDLATTYEKKPVLFSDISEDYLANQLGTEFGKGEKAITNAFNNGNELLRKEEGEGKNLFTGHGTALDLDQLKFFNIDTTNLPSAFQANILSNILNATGTKYDLNKDQLLRDYYLGEGEGSLGFKQAIGENEKKFLKAKRALFIDYISGRRTGEVTDDELKELQNLQARAQKEAEDYVAKHENKAVSSNMDIDGQTVEKAKWLKQHNYDMGYRQADNIELFGMTKKNIEKALQSGLYFNYDASQHLRSLWNGGQGGTPEVEEFLKPTPHPKSPAPQATPVKPVPEKQNPSASNPSASSVVPIPPAPSAPAPTAAPTPVPDPKPVMYNEMDGEAYLREARRLEKEGKKTEAEDMYKKAEEVIRATSVSGHLISTLAGQDGFNTPIMAYANLYGIRPAEDKTYTSEKRKTAGDMAENYVIQHLQKQYAEAKTGETVLDPLDVFNVGIGAAFQGEARVEADKKLRRDMAFDYFNPTAIYKGLKLNGVADAHASNIHGLRGMWDGLIVDQDKNIKSILEMKTMSQASFDRMINGENTDRTKFDENGVPLSYKLQAAAYARAMGLKKYRIAMTGLTEEDYREAMKAKEDPSYKPKFSELEEGKNFKTIEYDIDDLIVPDADENGNLIYEDYEKNGKKEKRLKMLRGEAAISSYMQRGRDLIEGKTEPTAAMHTDNKRLRDTQSIIIDRLIQHGLSSNAVDVSGGTIPFPDLDIQTRQAIADGDVKAIITSILNQMNALPQNMEKREAIGDMAKTILGNVDSFNANMRKEIYKNTDSTSSQIFMRSSQSQIDNNMQMLKLLKEDPTIQEALASSNPGEINSLSHIISELEAGIGTMVNNRISAAVMRSEANVKNAKERFEEILKGKDGTEGQRNSLDSNVKMMKDIKAMAEEMDAEVTRDGLTKEQREVRRVAAEKIHKQYEELNPLMQQANAKISSNAIDSIDEAIGKQTKSPQELANDKVEEMRRKVYAQGKFLIDAYSNGGINEQDFQAGMTRLFGDDWAKMNAETQGAVISGKQDMQSVLSSSGIIGDINNRYAIELNNKIIRDRDKRFRSADKNVRTNDARLAKKTQTPEELAEEMRYQEQERIRETLWQYYDTFALSKDPEEQAAYMKYAKQLLGDDITEEEAFAFLTGTMDEEKTKNLGGQFGLIDSYVRESYGTDKYNRAKATQNRLKNTENNGVRLSNGTETPMQTAMRTMELEVQKLRQRVADAWHYKDQDGETYKEIIQKELGAAGLDDALVERIVMGEFSDDDILKLGGNASLIRDYSNRILSRGRMAAQRSTLGLFRKARKSGHSINMQSIDPLIEAQEMRQDKEGDIRDNLQEAWERLHGQDDDALLRLTQSYLGNDADLWTLDKFLNGTLSDREMQRLGGQWGQLDDYQNRIQAQVQGRRRRQALGFDRRDRSLRMTLSGRSLTPENQARQAVESATEQMRSNLEERRNTLGTNDPSYLAAVRRTLGNGATVADAEAFINGTETADQRSSWSGDYGMLGGYGDYMRDQATMQRTQISMSVDQLRNEHALMQMRRSPFANTWGMRVQQQALQTAQQRQNWKFRMQEAEQRMRMMSREGFPDEESPYSRSSRKSIREQTPGLDRKNKVGKANVPKKNISLEEAVRSLPTEVEEGYAGVVMQGVDESKLTDTQRAQIAVIHNFAKQMGVRTNIREHLDGGNNGEYKLKSNEINVALDAEGGLITRTMGHEMTHYIQDWDPEAYKNLKEYAENLLINTKGYDLQKRIKDKLAAYNTNNVPQEDWLTEDEAKDEVIADSMWDVLNGKNVINDLQNKGELGNKISERLDDYSDAFHNMGENLNPEAKAIADQSAEATDNLRAQFFKAAYSASVKRQQAMGPNQKKKYSPREEEQELKQQEKKRPSWMNEPGNPRVWGNKVFTTQAVLNESTGKYSFERKAVEWDKLSSEELKAAKNGEWLVPAKDFYDTGRMEIATNPEAIANLNAQVYASRDSWAARNHSEQVGKDKALKIREDIEKELKDPNLSTRDRKRIVKKKIKEIQLMNKKLERTPDGYANSLNFQSGKNAEIVNRDLKRLDNQQKDEKEKDEKAVREAETELENYQKSRKQERAKIANGEIQYPEAIEKQKRDLDIEQELLEQENKREIEQAKADAQEQRAKNATEFYDLINNHDSLTKLDAERRDDEKNRAISEAVAERKEKLNANEREKENLTKEKTDLSKKYKDLDARAKKGGIQKNPEVMAAISRYKEINTRLAEIGKENTQLSQEIDPNSEAYKTMVSELAGVKEADQQYEESVSGRKNRIKYLQNDAEKEVQEKLQARIDKANGDYRAKREALNIKQAEVGDQISILTTQGQEQKAEELRKFDEDTKVGEVERDAKINQAKETLETNNKERARVRAELNAEKISDSNHRKEGYVPVSRLTELKAQRDENNVTISMLQNLINNPGLLKDGESDSEAQELDQVKNSASSAAGALDKMAEAAQNASGTMNSEHENTIGQGQLAETGDQTQGQLAETGDHKSENESSAESEDREDEKQNEENNQEQNNEGLTERIAEAILEAPEEARQQPILAETNDSQDNNRPNLGERRDNNPPTPPDLAERRNNPEGNYQDSDYDIYGNRYQLRSGAPRSFMDSLRETWQGTFNREQHIHQFGPRRGQAYNEEEEREYRRRQSANVRNTAISNIGSSAINMLNRSIASFGRGIFNNAISEAKNFVQQYDALMNQIQVITKKTGEEMENISSETIQQALELKTSVTDIATIKADLYRQGLDDTEVNERMEQVVQFSKVTGIKASESVKIITTAMNTGLADSAQQAMDVLTALGDAAATTADQIQKGIQKAGSAAKVAGVSYEELATLMTVGTSKTQLSGQQIGTALQTIFARMNKVTESNYISDLEGGTTSLNDVESALALVGVDLRDSQGSFRSSYEVLRDLSGQWNNLSDTQKSLVTNAFAGSRQSNIFQTLMEGMSEDDGALLDQYLGLANDSEGTTQSKYEIAMQSLSASMEQVKTAWDAVVQAFVDSNVITDVLGTVTNFLTGIADTTNNIGSAAPVVGAVVVAALAGVAAAIGVASAAAKAGTEAAQTFWSAWAGPVGWIVGIGSAIGLIAGMNGLFGGSSSSEEEDLADVISERTSTNKSNTENLVSNRADVISAVRTMMEEYNKLKTNNEKAAYASSHLTEFNDAVSTLTSTIPNTESAFKNVTLSSENLADALDAATQAAEEQNEEDRKKKYQQTMIDVASLASQEASSIGNEIQNTYAESYTSILSPNTRKNQIGNTLAKMSSKFVEDFLSSDGTYGNSFFKWITTGENLQDYSNFLAQRGQSESNSDQDVFDNILKLTYGTIGAPEGNANSLEQTFFSEKIQEFLSSVLLNSDQTQQDYLDVILDAFIASVSSDELPTGWTTSKVKETLLNKLKTNSTFYNQETGTFTFDSGVDYNNLLSFLFSDSQGKTVQEDPSSFFRDLTNYDYDGSYIYTVAPGENVGTLESDSSSYSTTFTSGNQQKTATWSYYDTGKVDSNNNAIYVPKLIITDSSGNTYEYANSNEANEDTQALIDAGIVSVDEELKARQEQQNSETYTGLSTLAYSKSTEEDNQKRYLAILKAGLQEQYSEDANSVSFADSNAFDTAIDEWKYGDTELSQVASAAISADASGASLAAWSFGQTDAGKAWMKDHGTYLYDTIMNADDTNTINTAAFAPLTDYFKTQEGENILSSHDFSTIESEGDYTELMANLKTQLGDDMYQQLEDGSISWDQAMEYLNAQHETNTWASYTDQERDLHTELAGYKEQMEGLDENNEEYKTLKEKAEECQKALDMLFTAKQIRNTRKYGDESEEVASFLEEIAKGGRDASEAAAELTSNMATLSDKKAALAKLKTNGGKKDDDAFSTLGISETDFNLMKDAGTWDNYLDQYEENLVQEWNETVAPELGELISSDLNIRAEGKIEVGVAGITLTGQEILDQYGKWLSDEVKQKLMEAGASATFKTLIEDDGNGGYTVTVTASDVTGHDYSSGGGGGGGKSVAEELVDKQKKNKTEYEHMVKMVQYQQTKYQNANELGNYGLMIEKEIEVEKKRLPVIEDNIKALKEQIAQTEAESDDWYTLRDAILEAEEEYEEINNTIEENIKKLEENQQAIYKLRTDLEDTVKEEIENRKSEEEDMLSGSVSMQETILSAIKQRYQDEWDLVKKDIEKKKQALEEEKSLIDERLQKRKDAADEQEKYEELAEYKKQLALISMDSTRTKDAAELREKIADLEEEIGWDIAEAEAEQQTNALQDEIDAYDDYVTEGDEKLEDYLNDANNFADEVNSVLKMTQEEMFNWMKTNVQDYVLSLNDAQLQMVKGWEDTYKQMYGIVDTYWSEINGVLTSKDTFLNYMKNSSDYINASEESRAQMLYNWEEAYDNWAAAQKKDADYAHSDDYGEGSYSLPYNTPHYDWNETLNEVATSAVQGYNATANAQLQALKGTTLQSGVTLTQTQTKQLKALLNASSYVQTPNFSTVDTAGYGNNNSINIDEIQIVVNEASFADEDDYDAFALKVGDAFVKQLSKRGITTANYSF